MTKQILLTLAAWIVLTNVSLAQDGMNSEPTGLAGDNFSLEGALALFQKSESPENFEQLLNTEDNHVNNLDLNDDGETDYVRVHSVQDKDIHLFILQVPVSENENQDVAVIQLEKKGTEKAEIQIVGDEEIFGEEVIVEPSDSDDEDVLKNSKGGDAVADFDDALIVVNVWTWPCVRFVYRPAYRPWVSPWRWRVYPTWWRPWRPLTWTVWHPLKIRYHRPSFRVVHTHRSLRARTIYKPVRVTSVTVNKRYEGPRNTYKVSRTKTTVKGPKGNTVTKKSTTVKKNGQTKAQKTTVKKSRKGGGKG